MGQLTLLDFRNQLNVTFGERNLGDSIYDQWINFALQELCSGVRFEVLTTFYVFPTVVEQYIYPIDFQPLVPMGLRNQDLDTSMVWLPIGDGLRTDFRDDAGDYHLGPPQKWTLLGNNIMMQPVPNAIWQIFFYYIKQPDILVEDTDQTEILYVWDQSVLYLAIAHGYLMLGEENRAGAWHNKAANSIATKMDEGTILDMEPGLISAFTVEESVHGTPNTR